MWQADQETPLYSDEDFVRGKWLISHDSYRMSHILWLMGILEERLHESIRRKSRVAELQAQAENEDIGSTNSINSINSTNYIQGLYRFYRLFTVI